MTDLEQLRYPIGRFERLKAPLDRAARARHIETIAQAPATFLSLTKGRSDAQLDTPYRPGGWTVRQVVHHVPDSHMNAYIRMKFAVTEDAPAIKAYDEAKWAELPEAKSGPLDDVAGAARRAAPALGDVPARADRRPTSRRSTSTRSSAACTLDEALALYSWHCRHHAGHIKLGLGTGD